MNGFPSWAGLMAGLVLGGLSAILLVVNVVQSRKLRLFKNIHHSLEREVEAALAQRLMSLRKLTMFVGANVDLDKILGHITATGLESFQCEQVSIMLLDPQTEELEVLSSAGLIGKDIVGTRQKVGHGVAGKVAATGEAVILGPVVDPVSFVDFKQRASEISASMITPIILRGELIGVLCVSSKKAHRTYSETDLQVLKMFSEIVAVCIRHAQQAGWMRQTIADLEAELSQVRETQPREAA